MPRIAVCAVLLALTAVARADSHDDAARALREDGSVKVRAQAAIVLGQRGEAEAVPLLAAALASDAAPAVRIAAAGALGRVGGGGARRALEAARRSDADPAVRAAVVRALDVLGLAFSIDEPGGSAGGPAARDALRAAIARHLAAHGWEVLERGGMVLKPTVLRVDVDSDAVRTIVAVKAALVAVDGDGRMAAMLESGARLSAAGVIPEAKIASYAARALDAAARALCEDLAARLGGR
ncbi:HEAT repeat domain-containing protein [Anaeromyxobacter sp. SG66]|uniref:HEAT repeat domain-containing protein n=1 Tax=Anaeromyxobacter sp. SG66 TaxID=2925410 RepID=UPI001F57092A|nr:HEAT repeat domain-containing protein [Anaeromyxobacter sp. SG66]